MDTTRTCPECHQPLSPDAPDGLCPQCLMKAAAGLPPNASSDGLPGDIIDIGDPAEVARKLPQFEILELLGRGGMGVVYKARQLQLDRIIALKILPPVDALSADFVARFTREARALGKLNHPNIVAVHDFGETGGLYYIVMEFVDGANLRQLQEARKLTPVEALAIVPKICDALQYAHEEGLVHRDIKPENLLIDKKGRVKIADFGLAKMLRREPLDMTLTLSGMTLGTMRYMAPEQMDKPETVDHRADLYSLGVVIYEMLTGETPVGRFELPSQKAQVDVRFDEIVLHALEKEPDRRYQHASEMRTDVEKVASTPQAALGRAEPAVASGGIPLVQEAGEIFAMRFMPRDATDVMLNVMLILEGILIGVLALAAPGLGVFLLCYHAGLTQLYSTLLGGLAGIVVILGGFFVLTSGAVRSIAVGRFGLTLNRMIGPSRFLPWSSIVHIQTLSRWDVVKTVLWPDSPPRACFGAAFTHIYRIACVDDCWFFGPKEPEEFLEAVRRMRNMGTVASGEEKRMLGPAAADFIASPGSPPAAGPVWTRETKPGELRALPFFFHFCSFAALLLGWVAAAVLSNHGLTGFVLGAVVMAAIVLQIGRSYANRDPLWLEKLRQQSAWTRMPKLFLNLLALAVVFVALNGGLFALWETSQMQTSRRYPTSARFEAHYKGKEYQLIRQLTAFRERIPAVELTPNHTDAYLHQPGPAAAWMPVIGSVVLLFFFFQQAAGKQAQTIWGLRRGGWGGAFSCTAIFAASLSCACYGLLDLQLDNLVGHLTNHPRSGVNNTVRVHATVTQAANALFQWAAENGYQSSINLWNLQTVPQGQEIGKAAVFHAWKGSPWDRWRMTVSGPERPWPAIDAEIVGSEEPAEAAVEMKFGLGLDSMPEDGSAKEKQWRAMMKSLSDAVSKAADFKPLNGANPPSLMMTEYRTVDGKAVENYLLKPPVKETKTDSDWPGLCGVFAAMLAWVFVTMRCLTPAPASVTPASSAPTRDGL